jgi:hypothetical protein
MCADLRDDYPVFTEPSRRFFAYVSTLGIETQRHLEIFPDYHAKSTHEAAASSKRQDLVSLKNAWEHLHKYLKPAIDADSLHLPGPLISALQDSVQSVEAWKKYEFVLFHTNKANYFQVPSGMARDVANQIAQLVGGTNFPPDLGLVGIPYSQASGLLLNCVLPHECAHFIFEEFANHDVEFQVEHALDSMAAEIGGLADEQMALCVTTLNAWVQETFCDLLAICLIGPAFSFAFGQLEAASVLVGRAEGEPADLYLFTDNYPSDVARFYFHRKLLDRLGWWEQIKGWNSACIKVLEKNTQWSEMCSVEGDVGASVSDKKLLKCYRDVCEWILDYLVREIPNAGKSVPDFMAQLPTICAYLKRAIVPSTIVCNGTLVHPSAVVLINAGYKFFLEDLPELLDEIDGQDPNSVASNSKIANRLEMWILKAVEDNRLLTTQEK